MRNLLWTTMLLYIKRRQTFLVIFNSLFKQANFETLVKLNQKVFLDELQEDDFQFEV